MLHADEHSAVILHRIPLWLDAVEHALEPAGVRSLARLTRPSSALAWVLEHEPDLLVVDLGACDDELDGLACLQEAVERVPGLRAIAICASADGAGLEEAFDAGAAACVLRATTPGELATVAAAQLEAESWALASSAHAIASR